MRRLLPTLLLLSACASAPPTAPALPEWDAIPAGIAAALCTRLQMDGIGSTGTDIAVVKVTQPIATPQALASLGKPRRRVAIIHRAIPVATVQQKGGGCAWKMVDALDPARQFDSMVIELSAPVANPSNDAAGIVVRASLGGTHASWYWIDLIRHGEAWSVGRIFPLPL